MIKIKNCHGCYTCTKVLPEVFKDNNFGGISVDQEEAKNYDKNVIEGACPNQAIIIEEDK